MKALNKDDCENIYDLLYTISVKKKESGVYTYQKAHGLKVLLVSDGFFRRDEIRRVAEYWVQVEDDPDIIDDEVDEDIDLL